MSRATTWALALLLSAIMSTSYLLDGPDALATEAAVAADVADAQVTAAKGLHTAQVLP